MKSSFLHAFFLVRRRPIIACLAAGGLVLASSTVFAQSTATINVTGSIIGGTCTLHTSNIALDIGSVDKSVFTGAGTPSNWSPPNTLIWDNCDATLISLTFTGTQDPNDARRFAVTGGATGVGIELAESGSLTSPFGPNSTTTVSPLNSAASLSLVARYVQTGISVTTGQANTTVVALITYT